MTAAMTNSPFGVPGTEAANWRVLLVEDDAGDALLVEELLIDSGLSHMLRWTTTLAGALGELDEAAPDCVLLDLHLPDATGIAAIHAIQAACPSAAIIVLTGLAASQAGAAAVASGAQDYLVKGQVGADLLDRALRYAVHRKQAERANAELLENRIRAQENARLERALLPAPLLTSSRVAATTRYLPGRAHALLGGDFLDVVQTSDGVVHAVIGDVCGHGPDEAALGVCLRVTWRALVLGGHRGTELLDLLERLLVAERPTDDMFATCTTLALDVEEAKLTVFLAGHHEPLLFVDGRVRELAAAHGTALGIAPGAREWRPTTVVPPAEGALMLYTDGLTDTVVGPGRRRLGVTGLLELIGRAPGGGADGLLDHLLGTARELNAGRGADDLAMLRLDWS